CVARPGRARRADRAGDPRARATNDASGRAALGNVLAFRRLHLARAVSRGLPRVREVRHMRRSSLVFIACAAAATIVACKGYRTHGFKQPVKLGGKTVSAAVLTEGERSYVLYCRACHGDKGD